MSIHRHNFVYNKLEKIKRRNATEAYVEKPKVKMMDLEKKYYERKNKHRGDNKFISQSIISDGSLNFENEEELETDVTSNKNYQN